MNKLTYTREYMLWRQMDHILGKLDGEAFYSRDTTLVKNYGFQYKRNVEVVTSVDLADELPHYAQKIAANILHVEGYLPNQMTAVNIEPGQGLPHQTDSKISTDGAFTILTLGAPIILTFTNGQAKKKALLEPCSCLTISEEARYDWQYGIEEAKSEEWQQKPLARGRTVLLIMRRVLDDFEQIDDELIFEMRKHGGKISDSKISSPSYQ